MCEVGQIRNPDVRLISGVKVLSNDAALRQERDQRPLQEVMAAVMMKQCVRVVLASRCCEIAGICPALAGRFMRASCWRGHDE